MVTPNTVRTAKGSYTNKFNRAVKLFNRFDELDAKFRRMVERGSNGYITENAKHALCCLLMMHTGIRIGNEGSAEGYMTIPHPHSPKEPEFVKTYGLTTLLPEHVSIKGNTVTFNFTGKKQVENTFIIRDRLIVNAIKNSLEYSDGNSLFNVSAYYFTKFVQGSVGKNFSPKDFRCMRANIVACHYVNQNFEETYSTKKEFKIALNNMFEHVAEKLNNTKGVCKKSYIDDFLPTYLETQLLNK